MWQRKQTLFLLLAAVCALLTYMEPFEIGQHIIVAVAAACNVLTIFLFKNRPLQSVLCVISMFLYLGWYLAFVIYSKQVATDASQVLTSWLTVLPAVSLVLTALARKAVRADEKLVRDSDRLRR